MPKWQPGLPLQVQPAKEVQKFGEILMTATVKMWTEEDDRYVLYITLFLSLFPLHVTFL
jgi:hypothetical protein